MRVWGDTSRRSDFSTSDWHPTHRKKVTLAKLRNENARRGKQKGTTRLRPA